MDSRARSLCIDAAHARRGDDYKSAIKSASLLLSKVNDYLTEKKDAARAHRLNAVTTILTKNMGLSSEGAAQFVYSLERKEEAAMDEMKILHAFLSQSAAEEGFAYTEKHTQMMLEIFESSAMVLRYFSKFIDARKHSKIPMHDACLLELPTEGELPWTRDRWQQLIFNNMNNPDDFQIIMNLLKSAPKVELAYQNDKTQKKEFSKLTARELLDYAVTYARKDENLQAAKEFHKRGISEKIFNQYLTLKPADNRKLIPDITIEQNEFTLSKLPSNDPRAAILGELTGCCQSLGSDGEDCAIYGIEQPNAGFYVITNKKNKIVSQFFAWRQDNHFVIDSLESSDVVFGSSANRGIDVALVKAFARDLLKSDPSITEVHIGTGGRTPDDLGLLPLVQQDSLCPPGFGKKYRDSKVIRTLAMSDDAFCQHLKMKGGERWWEGASKKLQTVEQLLHCLDKCPLDQYEIFKDHLNGKIRLDVRSAPWAAKYDKNKSSVVPILFTYLNMDQCIRMCDCVNFKSLPEHDVIEFMKMKIPQEKINLFLSKYFQVNEQKDWLKSAGKKIVTVEQLAYCVGQSKDEEWQDCRALLLDNSPVGSVIDELRNNKISLFVFTPGGVHRWGAIGYVLANVSAEKCNFICSQLKDVPMSYADFAGALGAFDNEENKKIFFNHFLEKLAHIDVSGSEVSMSLKLLRNDTTVAAITDMIRPRLHAGQGGIIRTVDDYIAMNDAYAGNKDMQSEINRNIARSIRGISHGGWRKKGLGDLIGLFYLDEEIRKSLLKEIRADIENGEFQIIRSYSQYQSVIPWLVRENNDPQLKDKLNELMLNSILANPSKFIDSIDEFVTFYKFANSDQRPKLIADMLPVIVSLRCNHATNYLEFMSFLNDKDRSEFFNMNVDMVCDSEHGFVRDLNDLSAIVKGLNKDEITILLGKLPDNVFSQEDHNNDFMKIWSILKDHKNARDLFFEKMKHRLFVGTDIGLNLKIREAAECLSSLDEKQCSELVERFVSGYMSEKGRYNYSFQHAAPEDFHALFSAFTGNNRTRIFDAMMSVGMAAKNPLFSYKADAQIKIISDFNNRELAIYYARLETYLCSDVEREIKLAELLALISRASPEMRSKILISARIKVENPDLQAMLPAGQTVQPNVFGDFLDAAWKHSNKKDVLNWIDQHINHPDSGYTKAEKIALYKKAQAHSLTHTHERAITKYANVALSLFSNSEVFTTNEYKHIQEKIEEIERKSGQELHH